MIKHLRSSDPFVTFGVGTYGHPAQQPVSDLAKPIAIIGTTQTGKTRLANSLARQQTLHLGSGQIIINAKPDPGFIREKARDAELAGKDFLHFSMAAKGAGAFQQMHPYEPPKPCYYDPLERGSGAVRARMLIDSVVHNESSDVYRRTAIEIAGLGWDIARLTGAEWDVQTGADGTTVRRKKRSLQVLLEMLNMDNLVHASKRLTVDMVLHHHKHLHEHDAQMMVESLVSRAASIADDAKNKSSIASSAVADTRSIVASFVNSSAFYPQSLTPGAATTLRIDLLRAIVRGEIVLFDLSAADYQQEATMLASMILLDLQNTVSTLRDFTSRTDLRVDAATPWAPVIVQLEELGSIANIASAESLIGLMNKSADVGVRVIVSSQSVADIRSIDSGGEYLKRLLNLVHDFITLQIGETEGDTDFCDFSGQVTKKNPRDQVEVRDNRWRLFTGASKAKMVTPTDVKEPRVPYGTTQALRSDNDGDLREMLWVTKKPRLTAVHTAGDEGPNRWFEILQMVPVGQPPRDYNPYSDAEAAERSELAAWRAGYARHRAYRDEPLYRELYELNTRRLLDTSLADAVAMVSAGPVAAADDASDSAVPAVADSVADPFAGDPAGLDPFADVPFNDVPPEDPFNQSHSASTTSDLPVF